MAARQLGLYVRLPLTILMVFDGVSRRSWRKKGKLAADVINETVHNKRYMLSNLEDLPGKLTRHACDDSRMFQRSLVLQSRCLGMHAAISSDNAVSETWTFEQRDRARGSDVYLILPPITSTGAWIEPPISAEDEQAKCETKIFQRPRRRYVLRIQSFASLLS